jgi:hypothetical protein
LFFETKYGLRLQVSDDTSIRIESIRYCGKRLHEEFARDYEKLPTSNVVKPRRGPRSNLTQLSYRLFPDWHTSYLWYEDWTFDTIHVDEDVIEDRYPRLAKFYFEWRDIYEASFERQECDLGSHADAFPHVEELVAWATEGFLMACWLALQDNVKEVKYDPGTGPTKYYLLKGQLEDELMRFLTDMEALLSEKSPKD